MTTVLQAVTDQNFDDLVLQAKEPVLVDFWAEWCGPCRNLSPILDELASDYAGQVQVVKLDVEANKATTEKYGVRGIPALILFKEGKALGTKIGFNSKEKLSAFIDELI